MVASLFRNFLLAERVMRTFHCRPASLPRLPPMHQHPLWAAWDMAAELVLLQLPQCAARNCRPAPPGPAWAPCEQMQRVLMTRSRRCRHRERAQPPQQSGCLFCCVPIQLLLGCTAAGLARCLASRGPCLRPQLWPPGAQAPAEAVRCACSLLGTPTPHTADFQPSLFFTQQLTAFELWLQHGSRDKRPPEQLPIVLQARPQATHPCTRARSQARLDDMTARLCAPAARGTWRQAVLWMAKGAPAGAGRSFR